MNRTCTRRTVAALLALGFLGASTSLAQTTERVSLATDGSQGNSDSRFASMSGAGRYVAFRSPASNLVPGDTNGTHDIFVRDRLSGTTERVSVATGGTEANDASGDPSISADGRFVAFWSEASNLVVGDTNAVADVFVRDRQSGTTERMSLTSGGVEAPAPSYDARISSDGRFVAFSSLYPLTGGDGTSMPDIFVRDRVAGTTEIVSVATGGTAASGACENATISGDGRFVAFDSGASDLVAAGDTNFVRDVFVRDRQSGTTERVSIATDTGQGNHDSRYGSISFDGRYVAFQSLASTLVPGDANATLDVFVRDRQTGITERVSVSTAGGEGNQQSGSNALPAISADGRFVAFSSGATNLVIGDGNAHDDVFVRDRQAGTTQRVSVATGGEQGNSGSVNSPSLSQDGRYVAFESFALNFVAGDTNGTWDVFVHDRDTEGFPSLCNPDVQGVVACPCSNPPSGPERGCDNSSSTGGASLAAAGVADLSSDSVVFTTAGEKPTALSIVLQGKTYLLGGVVYGQGVRCVASAALKRLYTKSAVGGSITAPNFGVGDATVSARSAATGDTILAGQSRWYLVYYRDPIVLGGCPAISTFNTTQTRQATWAP